MATTRTLRRYLAELVLVFVGVALAFAVENLREGINERAVEAQYLSGFRRNLTADLAMLREQQDARRAQVDNALVVLGFYDGRTVEPQALTGRVRQTALGAGLSASPRRSPATQPRIRLGGQSYGWV